MTIARLPLMFFGSLHSTGLWRRVDEMHGMMEHNNTVNSTQLSSSTSSSKDKVIIKLPRTRPRSPTRQRLGEITPDTDLVNSYRWSAQEKDE